MAVVLAAIGTIACSGDDGGSTRNAGDERFTRRASAGGIDIQVRWLASDDELGDELAEYPLDGFALFEVSLDTHSGDLGSVDMVNASRLAVGGAFQEPEAWVSESDDAHHRSGVLVFTWDRVLEPAELSLDLGSGSFAFGWDEAPGQ